MKQICLVSPGKIYTYKVLRILLVDRVIGIEGQTFGPASISP